jgi:hypothetical protein
MKLINELSFWIKTPRILCKIVLFISKFLSKSIFELMCLGYSDDYEDYTGLDWCEDRDLDFFDKRYLDFRLYIKIY